VAKFTYVKEREKVRRASPVLKKRSFYINEQFPKDVGDRRKSLLPKLREARATNKKAWLSYDKLFVDGKLVRSTEAISNTGPGSASEVHTSAK
jgi:hypothetical protein